MLVLLESMSRFLRYDLQCEYPERLLKEWEEELARLRNTLQVFEF